MKILYLNTDRGIPVLGDKGASVHVRAFIRAAAALGHDVVLACPTLGQGNPPPPAHILHLDFEANESAATVECTVRGVTPDERADPIVAREIARLCHDRTLPSRLLGELERMRFAPDLVYERHALFHDSGAHIATALGVPRLLEVNAPLIDEQARYRGLHLREAAATSQENSYRCADAIIAVSEAVAEHVRGVIGPSETLHVVPNGVDLALFAPGEAGAAGAAIRRRLGIDGARVIGFVGSFKPWHGIGVLLDAFAALARGRPDLVLLAVGDGPDLAMARERAAQPGLAGRVLLPGRIAHTEVPAWTGAMDLTVAPYLPQPDFYFSPMKVIESLAAGKPVVAPLIGQIRDLVADGETGLLFEPGDAAALGAALAHLLDDPSRRHAMGEAGRRFAASRSWTAVVHRILDLAREHPLEQAA